MEWMDQIKKAKQRVLNKDQYSVFDMSKGNAVMMNKAELKSAITHSALIVDGVIYPDKEKPKNESYNMVLFNPDGELIEIEILLVKGPIK